MRVHGRELGRIEAAESTASFDMPMREPELADTQIALRAVASVLERELG